MPTQLGGTPAGVSFAPTPLAAAAAALRQGGAGVPHAKQVKGPTPLSHLLFHRELLKPRRQRERRKKAGGGRLEGGETGISSWRAQTKPSLNSSFGLALQPSAEDRGSRQDGYHGDQARALLPPQVRRPMIAAGRRCGRPRALFLAGASPSPAERRAPLARLWLAFCRCSLAGRYGRLSDPRPPPPCPPQSGYRSLWSPVQARLALFVPWAHRRALQITRRACPVEAFLLLVHA